MNKPCFYCCSLNFPPKPCAAMENNYAPFNATLLTLATRTGKGCKCWYKQTLSYY